MRRKKLTVLVVNWNGLDHLKGLLPTLRKQTFRDFEVLISDQGSTDGSVEWLKKNKIRFIQNGRNTGFSGGVNRGLRNVRTKYVAVLNDDMKIEPNCLRLLMGTIEGDESIGAVQGLVVNWDGTHVESTGLVVTYGSFIATRDKGKTFVKMNRPHVEVDMVNGSATIYRMSVFKKIGMFDEDFNPIYNEDADMSIRMRNGGYKMMLQPNAVLYHHSGPTAKRLGYVGRLINHRNRYRLMRKHWTRAQWAKAAMWFPLVAGFYIVKSPDLAPFQATFEFLTGQLDRKKWRG
ncbi:MAG: glycosyltransferase family 2 protein [Candidatus Aenigmarchaeota archaeon]|nr:glycosyltransferase family 2 protein [Candidatus Aenigmarchaeota archaeon]